MKPLNLPSPRPNPATVLKRNVPFFLDYGIQSRQAFVRSGRLSPEVFGGADIERRGDTGRLIRLRRPAD